MMLAFMVVLMACTGANALTINVQDQDGNPVTGFRWLVEEDNTLQTPPGVPSNPSIATTLHKSHAPVVAAGEENTASANVTVDAGKPYMVSVLPFAGFTMSGKNVPAGAASVDVVVHSQPIPTAQISVYIFNDNAPINNAPDATESGLEGFKILLDDTGGQLIKDAFDNPLGTTYKMVAGEWTVDQLGPGFITTDANGEALIKYLAPGKYGVRAVPPTTQAGDWIQTATIEGTPTIDAWIKAGEPETFIEGFGTGAWHVFIGYINQDALPWGADNGGIPTDTPPAEQASIFGTVNFNHFAQPPVLQGFHKGTAVGGCYVGLNDPLTGEGLALTKCVDIVDTDGIERTYYQFENIPAGTYELVAFDKNLDALFTFQTVIVNPGTNVIGDPAETVASLDILCSRWFGHLEGHVFFDTNQNGFLDSGEPGMVDQAVILRYRDGSEYQAQATDGEGYYAFEEVFPFFKFLVVEVDFARFKATGMTAVADFGGEVPLNMGFPYDDKRNPQVQPEMNPVTGDYLSRTEQGEVLTQAMQLFLGQYNRIDWGKNIYATGENGGISGIVFYAYTRAEPDPTFAVGDPWEPGIPRVQVALYTDMNNDKIIDDLDGDSLPTRADVDNYPQGNFPGDEDVDHNANGVFDYGDAVQITYTDSFDDDPPTDCIWNRPLPFIAGAEIQSCVDTFGVWNQIRPGVFDGGYAFADFYPQGLANVVPGDEPVAIQSNKYYIVESTPPKGYETQKEEDLNVDFGDELEPSLLALPPECVGDLREVPPFLSMQTVGGLGVTPLPGIALGDMVDNSLAGQMRHMCDVKRIRVTSGQNAAVEFHQFTHVPKASRAVGFCNNDLSAEFDTTSPVYGEKGAPKWLPVSFRDWTGNEVAHVYMDEFGHYNAMVPANFTNNLPTPMGLHPSMITAYLNYPFLADGTEDPSYDPNYSQMAWTFMYYAGRTSYLDTPILPVGAHQGYPGFALDVEPATGTPVIAQVTGPAMSGPLLQSNGDTLTITAVGDKWVPNPASSDRPEEAAIPKTVLRDFGFGGTQGQVTLGGVALNVISWTNTQIEVSAPDLSALATGQLMVKRDNGKTTETGVTVHVQPTEPIVYVSSGESIQAAVDAAADGSIVMVRPGTYREAVIVYKNVIIQGFGGESSKVYPFPEPLDKLAEWHAKVQSLIDSGDITGLGLVAGDPAANTFRPIEMPGFMVLTNQTRFDDAATNTKRMIDGMAVTGAIAGGGILVPDLGRNLKISNNVVYGNQGTQGGGITVGMPDDVLQNPAITINYNKVVKNSGRGLGGGGVTIYGGADGYTLADNRIAGNFTTWNGGGIAHVGRSDDSSIVDNKVLLNEVFSGGQNGGAGGGMFVSGDTVLEADGDGAGDLTIARNLIQGNLAGASAGGGIRAVDVNGADAATTPFALTIVNNLVVNNIAASEGGGISLQNAVNVSVNHNTIAYNDSTATSREAFLPGATLSTPQGAGLVTWAHSAFLTTATGQTHTDPELKSNIFWHNRSFKMDTTLNGGSGELILEGFDDLAVAGAPLLALHPEDCIVSDPAADPGPGNTSTDPQFVQSYANNLLFAVVIDEGGNNINSRFYPLTAVDSDYHLAVGSPAINQVTPLPGILDDVDGQARPQLCKADIGADEVFNSCSGDINFDGVVNVMDFLMVRGQLGCTGGCSADLDCDGDVTVSDLLLVRSQLGSTSCLVTP